MLDTFWIGSVAVVVLTGLYTVIGGLRAVAYTDAAADDHLHHRLGAGDRLRADRAGRLAANCASVCGSDMFNLWKPLVPAGMEGTWAPGQGKRPHRLVLQRQLPLAGHAVLRPDRRPVVLVYRSVHRAAGAWRAPNETIARRGSIAAAFLKLLPVFIFIIPGMICFALAKQRLLRAWTDLVEGRPAGARPVPGGLPADGQARAAGRACAGWSWPGCSRR